MVLIAGCTSPEEAMPSTLAPTQEPTAEPECSFEEYFWSVEPFLRDHMDSVTRVISGELSIEDLPAELEIAVRQENTLDEVVCVDEYPELKSNLANSIHFYKLGLETFLEGESETANQYMETSRQYLISFSDAFEVLKEANTE